MTAKKDEKLKKINVLLVFIHIFKINQIMNFKKYIIPVLKTTILGAILMAIVIGVFYIICSTRTGWIILSILYCLPICYGLGYLVQTGFKK